MFYFVIQLLPGLQYPCIQGDISVDASLKDYFIVKSKVIFSKVIRFHQCQCQWPSIMHLIIHASLYNSSDV